MPGLPVGWESDYDGQRWFYKYKANGHVQYHFPSEGDEFPDYVDALSPAPILAPEERLESQQQVKRLGSTAAGRSLNTSDGVPYSKLLPWQRTPTDGGGGRAHKEAGGMSATARPVSFAWEGEVDKPVERKDEHDVFRPESFMFLGPGTYNDVSPLADEEEEAARRVIAGDGRLKGISPDVSTGTTPQVKKSELESPAQSPPAATQATVSEEVDDVTPPPEPLSALEEEPVVHMIDSREMPTELPGSEPWQDPVGRLAEMATAETPVARIETHPEPVEIGEGREITAIKPLGPVRVIEVCPGGGSKPPAAEEEKPSTPTPPIPPVKAAPDAMVEVAPKEPSTGCELEQPTTVQKPGDSSKPDVVRNPTAEDSAPVPRYQPYQPGVPVSSNQPRRSDEIAAVPCSLQRERSLMMGPTANGVNANAIPTALSLSSLGTSTDYDSTIKKDVRSSPPGASVDPTPSPPETGADSEVTATGITKFPSVLRPARGRALSQPRAVDDMAGKPESIVLDSNQHPAVMTPGARQRRQRSDSVDKVSPGANKETQGLTMREENSHTPYQGPQNQALPPAQELPPRAASALPSTFLAMQRASSVTTRKAVPVRSGQSTGQQGPKEFGARTPLGGPATGSPPQGRERRHSSFSPSDVSSLGSRHGSMSFGAPFESPSPMENVRRDSSATSLAQSASFSPSPPSLTPGSGRQGVVSPPASGAAERSVLRSSTSDMSYFSQGTGSSVQKMAQGPLPVHPRSQSTQQVPSPSALQRPAKDQDNDPQASQSPPAPAHHLTSIEEHDEVASSHDGRSTNSQSTDINRRQPLASNPNPPPMPSSQLRLAHLQGHGHTVQHVQNPGQPLGPRHSAPAGQPQPHHRVPGTMPHQGPHPVRPPIHGPIPPHPSHLPRPPGPHGSLPGQPPLHIHPGRTPAPPQSVPPARLPPSLVPASTAPTTSKEKDKKWTKWFKSKAAAPAPPPPQPAQAPNPSGARPQPHSGSGQHMQWPANHPIPQGPPPGTPGPPVPWSPNQIRPQLHHPHGHLPPRSNDSKPSLAINSAHHSGHWPAHAAINAPAGPPPFAPRQTGAHPHRQSMPPLPSAGGPSRLPQRASGDYSGRGWDASQAQWR